MRPLTVLICALGGEGGGVLSNWLVDVARHAGHAAQATSIPGVAQRTGATTYYLEFAPRTQDELSGRQPVFSLYPVPGQIDLLVSSELLETARQVSLGMTSVARTRVVSSSSRTLTTAERMELGDGRLADSSLADMLRTAALEHHLLDMARLTRESGTVVSAVMLGAVAASGVLPFERAIYESVIKAGGRGAQASLRGFAAGYESVTQARERGATVRDLIAPAVSTAAAPPLRADLADRFPAAVHTMLSLGHARLVEYQDEAYAQLYIDRLARVLEAERVSDPHAANSFSTTREMARWLALWMAFDDIVRVADLKLRASRRQRIAVEAKARDGDILKIWDHFKPGVPEFVGLLPAALARALVRWDARRQQRGLAPWSFKLVLGTHTVVGALALRLLGAMKGQRRRGQRFSTEQAFIERWLGDVIELSRSDWRTGHELALCGRLIKGYGSTNERGKESLLHVLDQLVHRAQFPSPQARAEAIAQARQAALADDAGRALDQTLQQHGAAPRPVREQPIRFVRSASAKPKRRIEAARG
ncbi:indolepyruvate oxidoreductase subunit beta family protein [Piscinibacter sp.]|uniref:indolepyruvate oxidoreductase subunit beta family protein n=1 Tax=Piscinibacter sp. TaxID=1903157 RepID=UPI002BF5113D|nr:indolepyruvate oxidoreductase subunit beta family protein [Albitalea sp.]HUG24806.1 indolepyruvate oxidoreductase subunit beta family protein [Albitalea sp.]